VDLGQERSSLVGEQGDLHESSGHELLKQRLASRGADLGGPCGRLGTGRSHHGVEAWRLGPRADLDVETRLDDGRPLERFEGLRRGRSSGGDRDADPPGGFGQLDLVKGPQQTIVWGVGHDRPYLVATLGQRQDLGVARAEDDVVALARDRRVRGRHEPVHVPLRWRHDVGEGG